MSEIDTNNIDEEILESNKEIIGDIQSLLTENIKTYSRDWWKIHVN